MGGDPEQIYVGGWSAGGHLTAMLMDEPLVAGGLATSGLFDLQPIRLCYLNDKLGLDAEEARRNSPLLNLPARAAKFIITYGAMSCRNSNASRANSWRRGARAACRGT